MDLPISKIVTVLVLFTFLAVHGEEEFHEELLLKPLSTGDVSAHFRFTTLAAEDDIKRDFHLFPRPVG